jgi:ABC-type multidrug transport system ATPase subunit
VPVIEIENLTKDFLVGFWAPVRALDNLSLQVNRGEIFGFWAEWSRKSTTLRSCASASNRGSPILGKPVHSVSMQADRVSA